MPIKFYNHQYYQSGEFIVVSFIGLRGVPQDAVTVEITATSLKVTINTPDYDAFVKQIDLYQSINPSTSTYTISPSKVEIKLHKTVQINWPSLDNADIVVLPTPAAPSSSINPQSFNTGRWDKFCNENREEVDTTGDNLFKILYKDATPDQKRAMLKSIQQSKGKTLNMNWDEVKEKDFEQDSKE